MKKNEWQARFGAKRRAIDKALLQECERSLYEAHPAKPFLEEVRTYEFILEETERARIARAFGRPQ